VPRPERQPITFSIDGLEIQAPENIMLADAAKYGDIEIPVFCYEPKLGAPVGACRMCLVEIEGIPKLQTACSSPVKDGMVVHTQTARVKEAQQAVVEFLLINHPLDCPVCDKGGECPLQDITFGWGPGRSRFIEPKRHFQKPLELSPLIAIDRERCILCYRCVRFSQELSEDYQLVLLERGAHTFVGTFDGHPYVAPFSGNIIQLCPVGALTSIPYRFRARPWDIEGSGSICMLCPAQCNTELTVRDDRVLRVLDRHHEGVDDGWLCDKGRFAYQAIHAEDRLTGPLVRDADGELRPATWEDAYARATEILAAAGERVGALAGAAQTNEEGMLLAGLLRDALGSPHLDSGPDGTVPLDLLRRLAAPGLQAGVADLEFAHAVLVLDCEPVDDAPILDLRIRKGVRRNKVKLAVATSRPSSLDPIAAATARFAPGHAAALLAGLSGALAGAADLDALAAAAGCSSAELGSLATTLSGAEEIVVLYGERLLVTAADRLLSLAAELSLAADGAGLIGIPDGANGRGLREVGVLPNAGPGLTEPAAAGRDAAGIAQGLADGELEAVYLLGVDPLRSHPGRGVWAAGLEAAAGVIAHAAFLTAGVAEHADVVFPSEAAAEKEGTVTHPDGRLQRLRPAIGRPGAARAEWQVLAELSRRLGVDPGMPTIAVASERLFASVPLYEGLSLERIGGRGVRWPTLPGAAERLGELGAGAGADTLDSTDADAGGAAPPVPRSNVLAAPGARLLLGTYRSIWAATEVEASPALKFLARTQRVELSPADAARLGLRHGEDVLVICGDQQVRGRAELRAAVPEGRVFLEAGIDGPGGANVLDGPLVAVHRVTAGNGAGGAGPRARVQA
jgi:NADH-quinone oxidoreductase subunit G